ncbi:MAG TPA: VWA domain-containing protein, partial [Thermoanaerobaculia bacterium]|nr:VWA domain-containing protein [Thermoanaerobaculia bacterium]
WADSLADTFAEVLEVRVVNVEVVVTDRDGRRVPGLGPEDFRLRVAGREVAIEYFTEVRDGLALERGHPAETPGEPNAPAEVSPGEPVGTSYLVFLDEMFMVGADRDRVLRRLESQLPLLAPVDRMAIVAFEGRRLEVLAGWTGSSDDLAAALGLAGRRRTYGLERMAEEARMLSGADVRMQRRQDFRSELPPGALETLGRAVATQLEAEQRAYAELLASQIRRVSGAAAGAMRAFSEASGRKVLLLLSGGWHFEPADAAADQDQAAATAADRDIPGGADLYASLVETANLLGYTIYPVDVSGLQGDRTLTERVAAGGGPRLLPEHATESTLFHLASRTGGKALVNTLRDVVLESPAADTRSYYWLGFTPDWERDDEVKRIEIDLLRPDLEARFRRGILDLSTAAEATARVESLLLLGPPTEDRLLPVRVGAVERAGRGLMRVRLTLAIPVRAVTFLPRGDGFVGAVELRMLAMDEDGGRSEMTSVPLELSAGRSPSPEGHIRYDTEITLRNVEHDVVVAVLDPARGTLVANRLKVSPAAGRASGP